MTNPNSLGSNDHKLTNDEWASLFEEAESGIIHTSRDDLPKTEMDSVEKTRAPGYSDLSEENMQKFETNTNSRTGKARTFSDMDLYPVSNYGSAKEQGEARKDRNDHIVWTELIPYEIGKEETSAEARKRYSNLIESKIAQYPRNEGESLSAYRQRVKEIMNGGDRKPEEYSGPEDYESRFKDLSERLERQVKKYKETGGEKGMSPQHVEKLIDNYLGKFVEKKISKQSPNNAQGRERIEKGMPEKNKNNRAPEKAERLENIDKEIASLKSKLRPEDQKWLNDRLQDVEYNSKNKEEDILRYKNMLLNDAKRILDGYRTERSDELPAGEEQERLLGELLGDSQPVDSSPSADAERDKNRERESIENSEKERRLREEEERRLHEEEERRLHEEKERRYNEAIEKNRRIEELINSNEELKKNVSIARAAAEEIKAGRRPRIGLLAWLASRKEKKSREYSSV